MLKKGRITYFDFAKGIGILLVVYGHIEYISDSSRGWISSFHMPLFFLISGMLMAYKNEQEKPFINILKKRSKGIIVPYLWFSLLYFFIDIMNVVLSKIDIHTFIENSISSISFYGVSVLWFLPALFIAEITAIFIIKQFKHAYLYVPISLIVAIIFYIFQIKLSGFYDANINSLVIKSSVNFLRVFIRGIIASSFVIIGFFIYQFIISKLDSNKILCMISGAVLFIINLFTYRVNECVDFHYIILKNVPMFYLCAIIGSISIVLISIAIEDGLSFKFTGKLKKIKRILPTTIIKFFGRNSLVIMATHVHCYVLYAGILIAWQIDTVITRAKSYVFLFNIMLFTMLIEILIVKIINKYFPFILGKKEK